MNLVNIENVNGKLVVSSRVVAEQLGKEHKHVIRDIKGKSLSNFGQWIIPTKYIASNGQEYDEYLLTKDGFIMLVFNYTGYIDFKEAYINKFNEMEKQLSQRTPGTYIEALKEIIRIEEEKQIALAAVEEKQKTINLLVHENKLYTTTEIAKELGLRSAVDLNKRLSEDKIQFKQNNTWVLYSKYSSSGYISIKQNCLDNGKIVYDRKWTGEGRKFLLERYGIRKAI